MSTGGGTGELRARLGTGNESLSDLECDHHHLLCFQEKNSNNLSHGAVLYVQTLIITQRSRYCSHPTWQMGSLRHKAMKSHFQGNMTHRQVAELGFEPRQSGSRVHSINSLAIASPPPPFFPLKTTNLLSQSSGG